MEYWRKAYDILMAGYFRKIEEKITLKSFPENFFKSNGIDDWDSFERFQSSVEGMSKMNPKSLDVFLNGLSINICLLYTSDAADE